MKKFLIAVLSIILLLSVAACHQEDLSEKVLKCDANEHWLEDAEGNRTEIEPHSGGTATYTKKAACYVCNTEYGEIKPHDHMVDGKWETNTSGTQHRFVCVCGEITEPGDHTGGTATADQKAICEICNLEYGDFDTHKHGEDGKWKSNETEHWFECKCGETLNQGAHTGGSATYENKAKCEVCNAEYGNKLEKEHVHAGGKATCVAPATCSDCGESYGDINPKKHTGNTEIRDAKEPTYDEKGYTGDTYCTDCGAMIEHGKSISKTHTHTYKTDEWKGDDANHWNECSCGDKANLKAHKGGVATSESKAVCDICGMEYGELDPTNFVKKEGNRRTIFSEYKAEAENRAYDLLDAEPINAENLTAEFQPLMEANASKSKKGNTGKVSLNDMYIDSPDAKNVGVYIGYKDWYFYKDSIEDFEGTNLFSQKELKAQLDKYQRQYDYCKQNGIAYYLSFAPNKNTIYPEYMYESYHQANFKRLDQLINYIRANSDIPVIDFRGVLLEAKAANYDVDLYHRLDTHWNQHAAFLATNALLEEVQKDFPAVQLLDKNNFAIKYYESYMKDQAWELGHYDEFIQEAPQYLPLNGWKAKLVSCSEDAFGQFRLAYKWKDGFQEGNHKYVFTNSQKADAPSAVIFTDSFGAPMLKFLAESFSKTNIYWEDVSLSYIRATQPDVVIVEVAERFLAN